jgi:hypothetical protein
MFLKLWRRHELNRHLLSLRVEIKSYILAKMMQFTLNWNTLIYFNLI